LLGPCLQRTVRRSLLLPCVCDASTLAAAVG
jgi:hypothetical protein